MVDGGTVEQGPGSRTTSLRSHRAVRGADRSPCKWMESADAATTSSAPPARTGVLPRLLLPEADRRAVAFDRCAIRFANATVTVTQHQRALLFVALWMEMLGILSNRE